MINKMWASFSPSTKQWINENIRRRTRLLTGDFRVLPDFLIIGASKSGTTSLFRYLSQHPNYFPAFVKEVHYFDLHYQKDIEWYRSHFPTTLTKNINTKLLKRPFSTGEASPYYLYYPHTPRRAYQIIPNAKIVVLLRNPIERAYSDYQHTRRNGEEPLGFQEALEAEGERLSEENKKILEDEFYYSFNHQKYSYLSRGVFADQLIKWLEYFSRDQILIIKSENFFRNPSRTMDDVTQFLELPKFDHIKFKVFNKVTYSEMETPTRKYLANYFRPHNQRLYDLLGIDLGWD